MRPIRFVALIALVSLASLGAAAADSPNVSPQADATLHDLGKWLKTGVQRLGDAVEESASDLWAAGKAALAAADDTLRQRQAAREQARAPDTSK